MVCDIGRAIPRWILTTLNFFILVSIKNINIIKNFTFLYHYFQIYVKERKIANIFLGDGYLNFSFIFLFFIFFFFFLLHFTFTNSFAGTEPHLVVSWCASNSCPPTYEEPNFLYSLQRAPGHINSHTR